MNEELNKELCQLLGICWHEPKGIGFLSDMCICGGCYGDDRKGNSTMSDHCKRCNPDFTSKASRVQLLKLIRKHKHFHRLIAKINCLSLDEDGDFIDNCIPVDLMTDDTGKLAIAARDFLKGQNHEGQTI
jgi:hypothetical protein